jgi:CRISPR-associated protein Csm3
LIVRDVRLDLTSENGKKVWDKAKPDLPYAELKTEVAIDRVTSAATPRTLERVPAGAIFGPAELVFNIYEAADYARLKVVVEALQLVEDDYLGGSGSRGSGKVKFTGITISARSRADYATEVPFQSFDDMQGLTSGWAGLEAWVKQTIKTE